MATIYLDNAATTAPHPAVIQAMTDAMSSSYANPSSIHALGMHVEKEMQSSRQLIAESLNCNKEDILFTSGGTEANNLAVMGSLLPLRPEGKQNKLLCTAIEHPSVLNVYKHLEGLGFKVVYLPVNQKGILEAKTLEKHMDETVRLVSIMWVNNELGTIQNIPFLGNIIKQYDALFHVDAVQAWGKIPLTLPSSVDFMSLSGHKIYGPKGIGVLYKKKGCKLTNLLIGSSQEQGLRPGTENTYAIAGLAAAVTALSPSTEWERLSVLRAQLIKGLTDSISDITFRGSEGDTQVPHILNMGIPGIRAEILIHSLESSDIYISTGAACSSRQKKVNHVLSAIGLDEKKADTSLRISLGRNNTLDEINTAVHHIGVEVKKLRQILNHR